MSTRSNILILLLFALTVSVFPQNEANKSIKLTGNLQADAKITLNKFEQDKLVAAKFQLDERKSPIKAGIFSLIIPGAGQAYNGDYWLTAAFVALEATFITYAVIYNNKGNNQTDAFQNFADKNWSVKRYVDWTLNHLNELSPSLNKSDYENRIYDSNGNVVWNVLNQLETDISQNALPGVGFTHNLPPHGDQQYFELIGKYSQYSTGWNDFSGDNYHNLSPNFLFYSDMRGEANDFYTTSSRAIAGIYINHVLSALEAAWGASRFNNNLSVKMRVRQINTAERVELVPTMYLRYSF